MKLLGVLLAVASASTLGEGRACHTSTSSYQDCRGICTFTNGCYYWQWDSWSNDCFLKHATGWTMNRAVNSWAGDRDGAILWEDTQLDGADLPC